MRTLKLTWKMQSNWKIQIQDSSLQLQQFIRMQKVRQRQFDSAKYINQYYKSIAGHDEEGSADPFNLWMHEAFTIVPQCDFGIEIGCGPIPLLAAFASRKVKNLLLTEYNTQCFKFIEALSKGLKGEHFPNWSHHFEQIKKMEDSKDNIQDRVRQAILMCLKIDLTSPLLFEHPILRKFDIITSSLCIEAVATTVESYKGMIGNLKKYLKPQGYIFLIGVLDESFYMVEEQKLPCFQLNELILNETMGEHGFNIIKFNTLRPENPPSVTSDFKGLFSLLAQLKKTHND